MSTTNLNIDGYYFKEENYGLIVFFLYQDGTYLYIGGRENCYDFDCIEEYIKEITNKDYKNNVYNQKQHWGVYKIKANEILILRYRGIGLGDYRVQRLEGKIIDLNNIHIANGIKIDKYSFKQYSPKPDSTNNFVK